MTDLEKTLAEARSRIASRVYHDGVGEELRGFDEASNIAREVLASMAIAIDSRFAVYREQVAEKDAEIARIRTALEYKNTTIERMQSEHDDALEAKDAEIARLQKIARPGYHSRDCTDTCAHERYARCTCWCHRS